MKLKTLKQRIENFSNSFSRLLAFRFLSKLVSELKNIDQEEAC